MNTVRLVFLNGVLQREEVDYVWATGRQLKFKTKLTKNAEVTLLTVQGYKQEFTVPNNGDTTVMI